jgi:uncharacterized membrane protein
LAVADIVEGRLILESPSDAHSSYRSTRIRLASIDLLRGAVMMLMALDHSHLFFCRAGSVPEYLPESSVALFLTRWITHFCAPAFFLLAGAGAFLSYAKGGQSRSAVSRFLWTRGLWLIALDYTVIGYAWTSLFPFAHGEVIVALGLSMILMALIVRLPLRWIAALGVGIIVTHNLLDRVPISMFGKLAVVWSILHCPGTYPVGSHHNYFTLFTVIPWLGVMASGYALGAILLRPDRRNIMVWMGVMVTIAFIALRLPNLYGNSAAGLRGAFPDYYSAGPWALQPTFAMTIASFLNTLKYPASLQFLLMTLGPILLALAWFDDVDLSVWWARVLHVFGRVPLFYYVLHLFLLHAMAVWVALLFHQRAGWLLYGGPLILRTPRGYGHNLPFIYAMWLAALALLYFPCKWFMILKQQRPEWWWLRYL